MSRRLPCLCLIAALVPLAGCGGSTHAAVSTAGSAAVPGTAAATNPAASTTSGPTATGPTVGAAGGGATNVRVPARFTIHSGGNVTPPTVSSPALLPVELTVTSGDGRKHVVILRVSNRRVLTVPAGGSASVLIPGLKAGRYVLEVDGQARGALLIGGQPGP